MNSWIRWTFPMWSALRYVRNFLLKAVATEGQEEAVREMMPFGSRVNDQWDDIADLHAV